MVKVNYLAVLIAVIANFALGGIWYQLIFRAYVRREFTARYSLTDFSIDFVRSLIMVWALAMLMARIGANSWLGMAELVLFVWFGFMAPAQLSEKLFGGRSWTFYLINTGYPLVSLLLAGIVISLWL
jgi:hypothetical protein